MTGVTNNVTICEKIRPPTITKPSGRRDAASCPNPRAIGTAPMRAASVVIIMGRNRSIMMTTLAALMGAVPIALGFGQDAASRRPLGLVIVGGLIFSQMVTLFVTPVIYLWLEWFQEHVLDKVPFLRSAHTHHEDERAKGEMRPA